MRALALACALVACGGSRPPPTVTVAPLPAPPPAETATPAVATTHPRAPEVLAPGQVTVVTFFATWCVPCKRSLPELEKIFVGRGRQVAVFGIDEDDEENGVREFVAYAGVTFPTKWDEDKSRAGLWKPETMPSTYVVDKHGGMRFVHAGYREGDDAAIAREVDALVAEP